MDLSETLNSDFEELKTAFTCPKCDKLLNTSTTLLSCGHVQCNCRKLTNKCYICNNPCSSHDKRGNHYVSAILKSIRAIENIFEEIPVTYQDEHIINYQVVVSKVAMKCNHKGESPLHIACKKGDLNKVKDLIKEGVDFNMTDYANWTPLHEAVQGNYIQCVEYLLSNGALVDVPGENYITPLRKAILLNHLDIAQMLIDYGANTDILDYMGNKPLDGLGREQSLNKRTLYEITPKVFIGVETIVYTNEISNDNKMKLLKAKVKFATKNEFLTKPDVTHYIHEKNSTKVNLNLLVCLLKGIFIVDNKWIDKPDKESFDSIIETYKEVNKSSVLNRLFKRPKLFDGMSFYIIGHHRPQKILNLTFSKEDLTVLIRAGGGKILHRPPIVKTADNNVFYYPYHTANTSLNVCDSYIIYHESKEPELMYKMKELKHKSSKWLIESVLQFKIID